MHKIVIVETNMENNVKPIIKISMKSGLNMSSLLAGILLMVNCPKYFQKKNSEKAPINMPSFEGLNLALSDISR